MGLPVLEVFPKKLKLSLIQANGCYCQLCSRMIIEDIYSRKPIRVGNIFQLHYVKFKSLGGRGVASNALVMCRRCHKNIHIFLDILRPFLGKGYNFFTTVYVHLFLSPQKDKRIYAKFPLHKYANSKTALARKFKNSIKQLPKANKMLLQYYMYKCKKCYSEEVSYFISSSICTNKLLYQVNKNKSSLVALSYYKEYSYLFKNIDSQAA